MFENMVLRRIFGPRRDEVTGEWRRLHNEKLNDLYSSLKIVRVIKSRRMRWAGHVARIGEERGCIGSWWGNWREADQWGDLYWAGPGYRQVADSCECGNEASGSVKCGEFLD